MDRRAFWERYMRGYDALELFDDYAAYLDALAAGLEIRPGDRVLDAGCGTGNLAVRLAPRGAELVGLDFSASALARHRGKCPSSRLVRASLEEPLPFGDGTFDLVTCLSVLFALSPAGSRTALREFRRVLKPGGRLVLTCRRPARSRLGLVWRHIRVRSGRRGAAGFARELFSTAVPLLRLLGYNCLMSGLARSGGYRRLAAEELLAEVRSAGFDAPQYGTTYEGFFHLVTARRPEREAAAAPAVAIAAAAAAAAAGLRPRPSGA